MNVELYKVTEDCWWLVNSAGDICVLEDMPTFFETYDFKSSDGIITQWKLLYFEGAPKSAPFEYRGELYKP